MTLDRTQLRLVDALMTMSAEWDVTVDQLLDDLDDRTGCMYASDVVWSWIEQHDSSPSGEREHC